MKILPLIPLLLTLFSISGYAQVPATEQEVLKLLTKKWTAIQVGLGDDKANVGITSDYLYLKPDSTTEKKVRRKIIHGTWRYIPAERKIILNDKSVFFIKKLTPTSLTIITEEINGEIGYVMMKPLIP